MQPNFPGIPGSRKIEQSPMPDENPEQQQVAANIAAAKQFMHGEMKQCLNRNQI